MGYRLKRNPIISFVLSFTPGLGQLYNGQLAKAFVFTLTSIFSSHVLFALIAVHSHSRIMNITAIVLKFLIPLLIGVEACFGSFKLKENYVKIKFNKWYVYVLYFLVFTLFVKLSMNATIYQIHKANSVDMISSIKEGDYFISDIFNLKTNHQLKQNDIILFKNSIDVDGKPYVYAKRIAGVSGDEVKITNNEVEYMLRSFIKSMGLSKPINSPLQEDIIYKIPSPNEIIPVTNLKNIEFLFTYNMAVQEYDGFEARIHIYQENNLLEIIDLDGIGNWITFEFALALLKKKYPSQSRFQRILKQNGKVLDEYTVKDRHYFVLGDNTTNSLDSRFYGPISHNSIVGIPKFIVMSVDRNESIFNPFKYIRWDRIGKTIE